MKKALIVIAIILVLSVLTGLVLTYAGFGANKKINSSGSIIHSTNLGVYSDSACTMPLTTVEWGNLYPGSKAIHSLYVRNSVSTPLTLSMTTSGWSPASANGQISIAMNREGTILNAGQSTSVTLTLIVPSSVIDLTNFSVQINLAGTVP